MFLFCFCATAPIGPGPPHSRGVQITNNDAPQSVESSERVISSSQRPIPDNTQHSPQTYIHGDQKKTGVTILQMNYGS